MCPPFRHRVEIEKKVTRKSILRVFFCHCRGWYRSIWRTMCYGTSTLRERPQRNQRTTSKQYDFRGDKRMRQYPQGRRQIIPWRPLFVKLLGLVFATEVVVTVIMDRLPIGFLQNGWVEALADALLLTICISPFFWVLLVRPLRQAALIEKTKSDALQEQIVDAILTYDSRGIITSCNPAAAHTFHYRSEEITGAKIATFVPELEDRVVPDATGASYRLNDDITAAYGHAVTGNRKGNIPFPLEISVSRIFLGEEETFLAIMRDVTERRQSEMILHENRERFRSLSESAPVGIFLTDTSGVCTYTNVRWEDITGIPQAESLGKTWNATVHPEDANRVDTAWSRYLASGREFKEEFRFLLPFDDEVRWVTAHVAAMTADNGDTIGYVGAVEDNTERKLAEQGRHKFNALLTATLEATADAILMVDGDGQVQIFNQKFVDMFDIPAALLEKKESGLILNFISEQVAEPDGVLNRIDNLNLGEEPSTLSGVKLNDGRQFDFHCQPIWLDDRKSGRVWSFRALGTGLIDVPTC